MSSVMPPEPVSIMMSAPSVSGTLSVTPPEPVSISSSSTSESRSSRTEPLPVSTRMTRALTSERFTDPDPVSTSSASTSMPRAVTLPEPVSISSRGPRTSAASMRPAPVSRITSPSAPRRSIEPEPESSRSQPRVPLASMDADLTSTSSSPSTFETMARPTPRNTAMRWPWGTSTRMSAYASMPLPPPEMRTWSPRSRANAMTSLRWPPAPGMLMRPNVPSLRTRMLVFHRPVTRG